MLSRDLVYFMSMYTVANLHSLNLDSDITAARLAGNHDFKRKHATIVYSLHLLVFATRTLNTKFTGLRQSLPSRRKPVQSSQNNFRTMLIERCSKVILRTLNRFSSAGFLFESEFLKQIFHYENAKMCPAFYWFLLTHCKTNAMKHRHCSYFVACVTSFNWFSIRVRSNTWSASTKIVIVYLIPVRIAF